MLETRVNPPGTVFSTEAYAMEAYERGAYLIEGSMLVPPWLRDPFSWGADIGVMHSCARGCAGHGDLLCGDLGGEMGTIKFW